MLLNEDIVYIEKPEGICTLAFAVDEYSDYFSIHQSFVLPTQDLHK